MLDGNTKIVLLVQNHNTVFTYFKISPFTIKSFEDIYGINSWKNSKPVLKVFYIERNVPREVQTIYMDASNDNWYINLDRDACDVFVKYGRVAADDKFIPVSVSNTVTTMRNHQAEDTTVRYVDFSNIVDEKNVKLALQDSPEHINATEYKPNPIDELKKN
ncbi:DUF4912 domain-containing protein [Clostridium cellulovorans]|uniref:DUF4912 domain-containing protein n=1 Tax=Clostridium cellulovorans (strain ATCC 35296 / DSM 3052 / OCM 3 / 743B) TaxID=573061 RepID=D9SLW3_CLOC7|nr:DUF4912 domain-containing protein [Clostridium cellulovorans]ADL51694.1 hypothetical protein Clocel_1950 [Clostridium cellulovorans 743B]